MMPCPGTSVSSLIWLCWCVASSEFHQPPQRPRITRYCSESNTVASSKSRNTLDRSWTVMKEGNKFKYRAMPRASCFNPRVDGHTQPTNRDNNVILHTHTDCGLPFKRTRGVVQLKRNRLLFTSTPSRFSTWWILCNIVSKHRRGPSCYQATQIINIIPRIRYYIKRCFWTFKIKANAYVCVAVIRIKDKTMLCHSVLRCPAPPQNRCRH